MSTNYICTSQARHDFAERKHWIIHLLLSIFLVCSITMSMTAPLLIICNFWLALRVCQNKTRLLRIYCESLKSLQRQNTLYILYKTSKNTAASMNFSHQSLRSGYLLHSESYVQLLPSFLQQRHHYPTSTHLTSDYLWQVDENAVTQTKTFKSEKRKLNATKTPNSEFQFIESTFTLKSLKAGFH